MNSPQLHFQFALNKSTQQTAVSKLLFAARRNLFIAKFEERALSGKLLLRHGSKTARAHSFLPRCIQSSIPTDSVSHQWGSKKAQKGKLFLTQPQQQLSEWVSWCNLLELYAEQSYTQLAAASRKVYLSLFLSLSLFSRSAQDSELHCSVCVSCSGWWMSRQTVKNDALVGKKRPRKAAFYARAEPAGFCACRNPLGTFWFQLKLQIIHAELCAVGF